MSLILNSINEEKSQWEQKHHLISELVKAGATNTSHLWNSTIEELNNLAGKVGIKLSEAPPMNLATTQPMSNQPARPGQPPGAPMGTQTARPAQTVQPAAQVNISTQANAAPAYGQVNTTTAAPAVTNTTTMPPDIAKAMNTLSPQDKTSFAAVLKKLSGIK